MKQSGIIIGGGASGLMAAIGAAENGAGVTILEHGPRVGKKILATGNGRCNLTNRFQAASCYRCGREGFPMAVIGRFPMEETLAFFRRLGILTMERDGYVYPASGQAQTVLDALREKTGELGVKTVVDCQVLSIKASGDGFLVQTSLGEFSGDFLILATGGKAAKSTGSDGSGYELAKGLGHRILKPLPALVQLRCKGEFFKALAGVRAEATVSLFSGQEFLALDRGEVQLTDYGISGIPVFQVSRYAAKALDEGRPVEAVLDFFPGTDRDGLYQILVEQREYLSRREAAGFLNGIFPKKLGAVFLRLGGIRPGQAVSSLQKEDLGRLVQIIKGFSVQVLESNSFDQAQVTMGGVDAEEVDERTMESRLVPGLYLVGELLDVDGICGGYNLQWAWSSGRLAGESAAKGPGRTGGPERETVSRSGKRPVERKKVSAESGEKRRAYTYDSNQSARGSRGARGKRSRKEGGKASAGTGRRH